MITTISFVFPLLKKNIPHFHLFRYRPPLFPHNSTMIIANLKKIIHVRSIELFLVFKREKNTNVQRLWEVWHVLWKMPGFLSAKEPNNPNWVDLF